MKLKTQKAKKYFQKMFVVIGRKVTAPQTHVIENVDGDKIVETLFEKNL